MANTKGLSRSGRNSAIFAIATIKSNKLFRTTVNFNIEKCVLFLMQQIHLNDVKSISQLFKSK